MAYEDVTLESDEEKNFRIGQIWKNHRKMPQTCFLIRKFILRNYTDGNVSLRVEGLRIDEQIVEHDMDARSMSAMFPYILFDPPKPFPQ